MCDHISPIEEFKTKRLTTSEDDLINVLSKDKMIL